MLLGLSLTYLTINFIRKKLDAGQATIMRYDSLYMAITTYYQIQTTTFNISLKMNFGQTQAFEAQVKLRLIPIGNPMCGYSMKV